MSNDSLSVRMWKETATSIDGIGKGVWGFVKGATQDVISNDHQMLVVSNLITNYCVTYWIPWSWTRNEKE